MGVSAVSAGLPDGWRRSCEPAMTVPPGNARLTDMVAIASARRAAQCEPIINVGYEIAFTCNFRYPDF
jgi:hypothetical protein